MGCTLRLPHKFSSEEEKQSSSSLALSSHGVEQPNRRLELTKDQKGILTKTYRKIADDAVNNGLIVFLYIFDSMPFIKKLFPFRDKDGEELKKDLQLKGHASRFMQVVGAVLENLDNADTALRPLLFQLGERHAYYDGFKPEYFKVYRLAMMYMCEKNFGEHMTPKLRDVWEKVFTFIMDSVRDGCVAELKRLESTELGKKSSVQSYYAGYDKDYSVCPYEAAKTGGVLTPVD